MITVIFTDPSKWPLTADASTFNLADVSDVKSITLTGDALLLAQMEFNGIPMPRHVNEWQDEQCTWYWTDAQFLAKNLPIAYKLNKENEPAPKQVKK